jgi:hypothetical protein
LALVHLVPIDKGVRLYKLGHLFGKLIREGGLHDSCSRNPIWQRSGLLGKHNGNAPRRLHGHPDFHDKLVGRFQSTPPAFALRTMNQGVRFVSYNRMDKKRRVYQPRVFDGRIITFDEIERIHKEVLKFKRIEAISDPMREFIETRNACLDSEQKAREQIIKDQATYSSADKRRCMRTSVYLPSYVEWLTCLEMERDVRKMRQGEPPATDTMTLPRARPGTNY